MKPKPFRIFRVGTHTDSSGASTSFTREDMAAAVKAYNEGDWRAPLVCGHPKGNAPAYGWVGKLSLTDTGDVMVDDLDKLNPDFAELMKSGAYRNRSASWYSPDHPSNPTPGVWQLRHLGMLGAQPPALKGLGDVEFHDQDGQTVEFADTESDWSLSNMWGTVTRLARTIRESIIADKGIEEADKVIPSWQIEEAVAEQARLQERARAAESNAVPSYSETTPNPTSNEEQTTMTPEEIQALKDKAAKLEKDNAELTTRATTAEGQVSSFQEQQAKAAREGALAQAKLDLQPLVTAGKLLPAQVAVAADFMVGLDDQTATFEFGEGDAAKKFTQRKAFLELLQAGSKQVDYSELTPGDAAPISMSGDELGTKAREYAEAMGRKGIVITSTQAVNDVLAGKTA